MICEPCIVDDHASCTGDMPDPEIECRFVACDCLHDPALMQRNAKVANLLRRAVEQFGSDDERGTVEALRRVLGILDPPKGKLIDLGARMRSVGAIPDWMERKR